MNFEIHTIILYLVVLVRFAWVLQQMAALPWYITLAHEKYIHSPGGHWREVPILANLVESNTNSTYLNQFTQTYHRHQDAFWQIKYFLETFRTSNIQALVFKNINVKYFD